MSRYAGKGFLTPMDQLDIVPELLMGTTRVIRFVHGALIVRPYKTLTEIGYYLGIEKGYQREKV